jgi:predicted  nucleic acid-binding Zn-ribbon protein
MATLQDLTMITDRGLQALAEVKQHVVKLANLEVEIKRAESTLAGLNGQIEAAKQLAPQLEQFDQLIRSKRSELADLQAAVAKGHEQHGAVVSALRDLRKQISGDPQHA